MFYKLLLDNTVMTTYLYTAPRFLNSLMNFAAEDDAELTVHLEPDVPEYLDALKLYNKVLSTSFGTLADAELVAIMDNHAIHHRYGLLYDYEIGSPEPKIETVRLKDDGNIVNRMHAEGYFLSGLVREFHPPDALLSQKRFRHIKYKGAQGRSIPLVKNAANEAITNGYVVTFLRIALRPRIVEGEYGECGASLYAQDGRIELFGEDIVMPQRPDLLEVIRSRDVALLTARNPQG